jgi:hypothetical protein
VTSSQQTSFQQTSDEQSANKPIGLIRLIGPIGQAVSKQAVSKQAYWAYSAYLAHWAYRPKQSATSLST